ncbi:MAG TPA: LytR C-terminal domain-containing protein [Gemmatimonadaceae bacterium]|nr:LytR C-terminal domain-containing protein [Gemmatimonadaceae bacterium]
MRRRRFILGAVLICVLGAIAWYVIPRATRHRGPAWLSSAPTQQTPDAHAPDGVRIKVEVLNATRTTGLARRATLHLRGRGFDVVETGTSRDTRDSTLVIDRSNHPAWARLVATALGGAAVQSQPDSSHYVDVTVLVGASWRPPTQPFHP